MFNYERFETISKVIAEKFSFIDKEHENILFDLTIIIILLEEDMAIELNEEQLVKIITIGIETLVFKMELKSQETKSLERMLANLVVVAYLNNELDKVRFYSKDSVKCNYVLSKARSFQ